MSLLSCALLALQLLTPAPENDYFEVAGDYAALYQGRIEPNFNAAAWRGHPYWEDTQLHTGTVCYDQTLYQPVELRYDIYNNFLVVKSPDRQIAVVPDMQHINYFTIDAELFVPYQQRFYQMMHYGQSITLLYGRRKFATSDIIEDKLVYHNMESEEELLLLSANGSQPIRLKGLKSLTRAYPNYKNQLRKFSSDNNLDWSTRAATRSSMKQCVAYLDNLLVADGAAVASTASVLFSAPTPAQPAPSSFGTMTTTSVGLDSKVPIYDAYRQGGVAYYDPAETEQLAGNGVSDLEVIKERHILDEVEVTGFMQKVGVGQVGMEKFRPALLKNIPLAMGEADVMKMLQTLPGVKSMGEASSGFNVRGGASDQNLILFNGNTIYNPMHLFGLFSAFNGDVIGETELYKSGIPSQYGGRISSVMNITSRVADPKEWHATASIGLLTSKATVEIPVVADRVTLLLGGRTTYSDWMLGMIPESSGYRNGKAGFWDLSGTLNININDRNRVKLFGYYSHDRFSFTPYDHYAYSNANGAIEWKSRINDRLNLTVNAGYDQYGYSNDEKEVSFSAARLSFDINQTFLKTLIDYRLNDAHTLQLGLHGQYYRVNPGKYAPIGEESNIETRQLHRDPALEMSAFVEDQWRILPQLSLTGGVRATLFRSMREGKEKSYMAPEFRLSASYSFSDDLSLKVGFNNMHQYIHKVSNTSIMSPTDTWTLSNANIRPQTGYQTSAGIYYQTSDRKYEASVDIYYKAMDNYLTYRSAGQLVMNDDLENDVAATEGRAYGIELQLRKPIGRLNGWVSYSYSRTELRQNEPDQYGSIINGGNWFAAEYDRPHEFKFVGNFRFTHRYSMSLNADYSTGRPTTLPTGKYFDHQQQRYLPLYSERNSYRLPDYFRVDWSFNIEPSHHITNLTHSWFSIGVYNLLGRKNAYSVYYQVEEGEIKGYQLSIFGAPIPFVNYNIKF